ASTEEKWARLARRIAGAGGVTLDGFG
nr:Chain B, ip4 [Homo sapiens]6F0H_D Chain D, ip4 [Homo sapiens]